MTPDFYNAQKVIWHQSQTPVLYDHAQQFMQNRVKAIAAGQMKEYIWLLEHPPLYTAGTSAKAQDLRDSSRFPIYKSGRGGQYTYHGPGQRIAYVMLDLRKRQCDIRGFVQTLEEWIILTLADFHIQAQRQQGRIGVWVNCNTPHEAKIAAIGIRLKKWVSFHGISLNVDPNLSHYQGIVPCGMADYAPTSLSALGVKTSLKTIDTKLKKHFETLFAPTQ